MQQQTFKPSLKVRLSAVLFIPIINILFGIIAVFIVPSGLSEGIRVFLVLIGIPIWILLPAAIIWFMTRNYPSRTEGIRTKLAATASVMFIIWFMIWVLFEVGAAVY